MTADCWTTTMIFFKLILSRTITSINIISALKPTHNKANNNYCDRFLTVNEKNRNDFIAIDVRVIYGNFLFFPRLSHLLVLHSQVIINSGWHTLHNDDTQKIKGNLLFTTRLNSSQPLSITSYLILVLLCSLHYVSN